MMSMHDRYYEPEDDDSDAIEERIEELLKTDNNPYTADNIFEALQDDALAPSMETLATLLEQGDTAAAGVVFSSRIYTYWEERTRNEVLEDL